MQLNFRKLNFVGSLFIVLILAILSACWTDKHAEANHPPVDTVLVRVNAGKKTAQIDAYFKDLCKTANFNGGILVAQHGQIIYENVHGWADFKKKDSLTISTRFQIASVSKQFTAVAILMLYEQGLLKLTDKIEKFYPDFPTKDITLHMLLTHRSGLANYIYFYEQFAGNKTPITNQGVVDLMIKFKPEPYLQPDKRYNYSNTNYAILAAIVEKVTGKSFKEFLQFMIFDPCLMQNTFVFSPDLKIDTLQDIATGYHYRWSAALPVNQDGVAGDKGIYTTLEDLLRWDQALYTGKIIAPEILNLAFKSYNHERKGRKNYGYGWRTLAMPDSSTVVYHGGWWRGFNTLFVRMIDTKSTIVIFSNVRTKAFYSTYNKLLAILDPAIAESDLNLEEKAAKETDKEE